jgi:hypothetical protein
MVPTGVTEARRLRVTADFTPHSVFTPCVSCGVWSEILEPDTVTQGIMSQQTCSACSEAPAGKLLRCSGCQHAWYCNSTCQRAHWKSHKAECKKVKEAKIRENMEVGAEELIEADAVRIVVQTPRIVVSRCADPDDSVFMQVMPGPGINEWLAANQVECWCQSVGTFGTSETVFAVAAFSSSQILALPQPRTELELSDHTRERGVLESEPIAAFGLRLCVTAAPALGQVSIGLRELPSSDPAPPLDTVKGTAILSSCFVLCGGDATRLILPPPTSHGFHAGKVRENADMKVWCGVGESITTFACSALDAFPRVPQAALRADPFEARGAPPDGVGDGDVIAIGMVLERCGSTTSAAEFEALSIQAFLHGPHARQQPEAAIPTFARRVAADPHAVSSMLERTDADRVRVMWMAQGRGM